MSDLTRVTQNGSALVMVADLTSSLANLTNLQEEAATGKSINQPSDNPAGTSQVLALNAQVGRFQQYSANISDGQSWLNTADTTLGSVIKSLDQVNSDVLSGANASANDSTSGSALASDVQAIKQQLLGLAGTTYNNSYIFSGTYGTDPYPQGSAPGVSDPTSTNYDPATAYAYAGSSTAVTRNVAPGQKVAVAVTADTVFGSGSSSVFSLLDQISQDLSSGDTSALSGTDLTQLQSFVNSATQAQGEVGAVSQTLTQYGDQATNTTTALQGQVSDLSDADEAQVATELELAMTNYQAALETTAKIVQPSLVQFLS